MSTTEELSKAYSGLLGEQVVVKRGGKGKNVMVLAKPRIKREPTEKQLAQRERLSLAAEYARIALQDPALKEMYAKRVKKGVSLFRTAANDYMQLPFVRDVNVSEYLGNPGDTIRVAAGDKFGLTEVRAKLIAPDGTLVESGLCVRDLPTGIYVYTATAQVPDTSGLIVSVTVRDIPGNITEKLLTL
jgi:hypothetical protein